MLVMRVSEHLFNYLLNKKLIFLLTGPHRPDGLSRVKKINIATHSYYIYKVVAI